MGLLGKKKDKKIDKKAPILGKAKPGARPKEEKPMKPEWLRKSKTELVEVETAIDLGADRQSRSNIMKMYEEKFGEKLEAPEFSAGLRYEYQLYEDADVVTKRDLSFLEDGQKGTKKAEAKAVEKKEKVGFFGRRKKKEEEGKAKAKETVPMPSKPPDHAPPTVPEEPEEPPAPSFFDPDKEVEWGKSGLACILYGKPLFPIARYIRYRAREDKPWMKVLILIDLAILIEFPSWIWRVPARIGYEIVYASVKSKAKKLEIDPSEYENYRALKEAVAEAQQLLEQEQAEERKAKRAKKKSEKKKAAKA